MDNFGLVVWTNFVVLGIGLDSDLAGDVCNADEWIELVYRWLEAPGQIV